MADFVIKQNDTTPSLTAILTPAGEPEEFLVGAEEVFLIVREKGSLAGPKFKSLCTIDDAATGAVSYDWEASDTDTAGEFQFEFEVVWPSGVETIPREGYKTLLVEDDLG
jgi:hypothetical protein